METPTACNTVYLHTWLTCVRPFNCLSQIWGWCAEDGACANLSDPLSYEKIHCSFSEGGSAPGLTLNPCQFITAASPPQWMLLGGILPQSGLQTWNKRQVFFLSFLCVRLHWGDRMCCVGMWDGGVHIWIKKQRKVIKDAVVCTFYGCIENGPSLLLCRDPVMNLFNSPGRRGALQSFYRDSLPYLLHWENSWWSL